MSMAGSNDLRTLGRSLEVLEPSTPLRIAGGRSGSGQGQCHTLHSDRRWREAALTLLGRRTDGSGRICMLGAPRYARAMLGSWNTRICRAAEDARCLPDCVRFGARHMLRAPSLTM